MPDLDLTEFFPFFQAMAGASATLIGLLFVAISVNPAATAVDGRDVRPWIRAASAFFAFVNVLALSLFALLPGMELGVLAFGAGVASAAASVGMIVIGVRYRQWVTATRGSFWTRALVVMRYTSWQLWLLLTYAAQAVAGWGLVRITAAGSPGDSADLVRTLLLLIGAALALMLLLAITRTWEVVGAAMPRLMDVLMASRHPEELPPSRRRDPDEPVALPAPRPAPKRERQHGSEHQAAHDPDHDETPAAPEPTASVRSDVNAHERRAEDT